MSISTDHTIYEQSEQRVAEDWRFALKRSVGFIPSHISPRQPKIAIYANLTKVSIPTTIQSGGGVRGKISDFSRASRKRMMEFLASTRNLKKVVFVTLTYPSAWQDKPERWKRDIDTFLKRLNRLAPKCFGMWRIEAQKRGAPHYHLILSGHPSSVGRFRKWIKLAWYDIVGSGDEKHLAAGTQCDKVFSRKHAMHYVSKYLSKEEKDSHQFTNTDGEVIRHIGKHWGIFNRAAADTSAFGEYFLSPREFVELRRVVSKWLKSKGSRYSKRIRKMHPKVGFAVFGLGDVERGAHRTVMRMLLSVFDDDFTMEVENVLP